MVVFAAIFPILIQSMYGVRSIDAVLKDLAQNYRLSRRASFLKGKLPAAMPYIATGVGISSSLALIVAVVAEFLGGAPGLGNLVEDVRAVGDLPRMYALILLVGFISIALNLLVRAGERRLLHLAPDLPDDDMKSRRHPLIRLAEHLWLPVLLVAAWWIFSAGSTSFAFPPLQLIVERLADEWLFDGFVSDFLPSVLTVVEALAIAIVVGVGLGVPLGSSPIAEAAFRPLLDFMRGIPKVLLMPPALVIMGVGDALTLFVLAFGAVWPILLGAIDGVKGISTTLHDLRRTYRLKRSTWLLKVALPAASPQILPASVPRSLSLSSYSSRHRRWAPRPDWGSSCDRRPTSSSSRRCGPPSSCSPSWASRSTFCSGSSNDVPSTGSTHREDQHDH
jgi:ABC-type nitrate/sulfonate/bicarbonate transport system permease component